MKYMVLLNFHSLQPLLFIQYACVVVAGLLHYLYTAAFYWMLCEGLMLYFKVVITFSRVSKYLSEKWWFFFLIGWGTYVWCSLLSILNLALHHYVIIITSLLHHIGIPVIPVAVSIGLIHEQYGNDR